jgi:hypothetical protein
LTVVAVLLNEAVPFTVTVAVGGDLTAKTKSASILWPPLIVTVEVVGVMLKATLPLVLLGPTVRVPTVVLLGKLAEAVIVTFSVVVVEVLIVSGSVKKTLPIVTNGGTVTGPPWNAPRASKPK